jgi:hypothetical protein
VARVAEAARPATSACGPPPRAAARARRARSGRGCAVRPVRARVRPPPSRPSVHAFTQGSCRKRRTTASSCENETMATPIALSSSRSNAASNGSLPHARRDVGERLAQPIGVPAGGHVRDHDALGPAPLPEVVPVRWATGRHLRAHAGALRGSASARERRLVRRRAPTAAGSRRAACCPRRRVLVGRDREPLGAPPRSARSAPRRATSCRGRRS